MAAPAAQSLFERGLASHQAGRLAEARACYEQALIMQPDHFDALHMLGLACAQSGELDRGVALMQRALALNPDAPAALTNLAWALSALGRFDEATDSGRQAIALAPGLVEAHVTLGIALVGAGRLEQAVASYGRAIALSPRYAAAYYNRANAQRDRGRLGEAMDDYAQAVALKPDFAEAWINRGAVLEQLNETMAALSSYEQAVALRPDLPEGHANRAKLLNELKRSEQALAAADRAIALRSGYVEAHNHRALALLDLRRLDEALAVSDRTIALDPGYPEAHNNRGIILFDLRRLDEAVACYERAIALRPDFAAAHLNRATALLSLGQLKLGFEAYRWRSKVRGFMPPLAGGWHEWEGEDLAGKSILIHGEQGFGDRLQFVRYAPLVAAKAARVTLATEPALAGLFRRSLPGIDVVTQIDPAADHDFQVALMDLPRLFGTTLETVPDETPYLAAGPLKVSHWAARLTDYSGLKIGLVWAGDTHANRPAGAAVDRRRSLRLAQFAPLASIEGVTFVSLQKGEPAAQASNPPAGMALLDFTAELQDFADTAALVANLDLVIAVDTAVAHLAGALGKPVWILSRYEGDWRWLNGREDSPWYPTARVFHQQATRAWDPVVARIAAELRLRPLRAARSPASRRPRPRSSRRPGSRG
jgi:tetratricopeptide (TPR) repeat protein